MRLPDFYPAPAAFYRTALADLNHDNKPDLVRGVNGNQIAVQLGLGDGTFGNPTYYPVGNQPISVLVADLNNDGNPDVIVANVNDGSLSVLLGNGDGTLQTQIVTNLGFCVTSMAVTDFNKDGKLDLILTGYHLNGVAFEGFVLTLAGNGDGTFGAVTTYHTSPRTDYTMTRGVVVGDFNGDSYPDFVISDPGNTACVVTFLNNHDGTFTRQPEMAVTANIGLLATGDFNGDGKLDLAFIAASDTTFGNTGPNNVSVVMGNGDGTFGTLVNQGGPVLVMNGVQNYSARSAGDTSVPPANNLVATDLDGDGILDLVFAAEPSSGSSYVLSVLRGVGDGTFTNGTQLDAEWGSSWISVADLNRDGEPDMVVTPNYSATETYLAYLPVNGNVVVTTATDEDNGTIDPSAGTGTSLREAWNYVSTLLGPQTIYFAANLAGQSIQLTNVTATGYYGSSALKVGAGRNITLQGIAGGRSVTIDGGGNLRPFIVPIDLNSGTAGSLALNDLTITNGFGNYGGAILNQGTLTVNRCTFTGNHASNSGGAVYLDQSAGAHPTASFVNCTIAGNSGLGVGGIYGVNSTMTLRNLTIVSNSAVASGALSVGGSGTTTITNCIIADNTANNGGANVSGTLNPASRNNLIGTDGTGGLVNGVNGNQLIDTQYYPLGLGPLADNGGSTPTMSLQSYSPAVNAGMTLPDVPADQRGVLRDAYPDIGAYEYQGIAFVPPATATFATGVSNQFQVLATGNPAPGFAATGLPPGVTLTANGLMSGTPPAGSAGYYYPVITATNGVQTNAIADISRST